MGEIVPVEFLAIKNFDQQAFNRLFPEISWKDPMSKREDGLVCYQPADWSDLTSWCNGTYGNPYRYKAGETDRQAYFRAISASGQELSNYQLYIETIPKPNFRDGLYGAVDGDLGPVDHLVPLLKIFFGYTQYSRCSKNPFDIENRLLPEVVRMIVKSWEDAGLDVPKFSVMLAPVLVTRLLMEKQPGLSRTNTSEWTSTSLISEDSRETNRRLLIGASHKGGAGVIQNQMVDNKFDDVGFRLVLAFDRRK